MHRHFQWVKPYFNLVLIASFFGVLLGLVTSLMTLWIGPTLQIILNSESMSSSISVKDLWPFIPSELFKILRVNLGQPISKVELFSILPTILIAIGFIRAVSGIAQFYIWEDIGEKVARDMRNCLQSLYLNSQPESRYQKNFVEFEKKLSGLFHNDIRVYKENLIRIYGAIPREILQIGLLLALLFWIHSKLMFIVLALCIPLGLLLRYIGKSLRKRSKGVLEKQSTMSETLQQRLLGFETIKHYRAENLESEKFDQFVHKYVKAILRSLVVRQSVSPVMEIFAGVGIAILIFLSFMNQDIANSYSGATQLTFFATFGLLMQSIDRVSRYFNSVNEAKVASTRIHEALLFFKSFQVEQKNNSSSDSVERDFRSSNQLQQFVVFADRISYTYSDYDLPVFEDLSIEIPGGKFCVLAGTSGKGKSTFIKLCLGILKPTSGNLHMKFQSEEIGYIPQDLPRFQLQVRAFMHYPLEETKNEQDKRILKLLAKVGLGDVFPNSHSLDGVLGSPNLELSGGQWQRLYFARILFKEYKFVILDEPSSALDPENEEEMIHQLKELVKHKVSVLAIAHRPAMIDAAEVLIQF